MTPLILSNYTLTSAAGCGNQENLRSIVEKKSGLRANDFLDVDLETWIGRVNDVENIQLPHQLKRYQCRNNQLAYMALQNDGFIASIEKAKKNYGSTRIGIFLGTSTSGILSTELAYRELSNNKQSNNVPSSLKFKDPQSVYFRQQHNSFSIADFILQYFKLTGPAQVISTACSSSAKVFACASRYIEMGLCDAAIVGGVDSLCLTTLYGFNSLELVAKDICRPADQNRQGLSIGEAAAFILLEKLPTQNKDTKNNHSDSIAFVGYGESSDAYHMSTPHPQGLGAIKAIKSALSYAKLNSKQIDYINLHGTATVVNDRVEDIAIDNVFSNTTPCSSTKGWTGHTLGAAGAVEAIYCAMAIKNNILPISLNTLTLDSSFNSHIILDQKNKSTLTQKVHTIASNSFGFGGNNCCLIFADSNFSGS